MSVILEAAFVLALVGDFGVVLTFGVVFVDGFAVTVPFGVVLVDGFAVVALFGVTLTFGLWCGGFRTISGSSSSDII